MRRPFVTEALDVPLAAFGTLSNGSDVRMLATPEDMALSGETSAAIEAFFYAAWRAVEVHPAPYFAFFRLEPGLWGLCQARALGQGAAGAVLVVWAALLAEKALDGIGWKTHRLLHSAFPDPTALPRPNTRLARHKAKLLTAPAPDVQAFDRAFDQLAFALVPDPRRVRPWHAEIIVDRPTEPGLTPLSAEGALFGLWDRLGRWVADTSYCSWAGIEDFGFPRPDETLHLTFAEAGGAPLRERGPRLQMRVGSGALVAELGEPSHNWLFARDVNIGVAAPPPRATSEPLAQQVSSEEVDELASMIFQGIRDTLVGGRRFETFRELAAKFPGSSHIARALPGILSLTVAGLAEEEPATAALAIDAYVAETLPLVGDTSAKGAVVEIALAKGLLWRLAPATLGSLRDALWGTSTDYPGRTDAIASTLFRAMPSTQDWGPLLAAVMAQEGEHLAPLRDTLIGLAWENPSSRSLAEESAVRLLVTSGPEAALALLARRAGSVLTRTQQFGAVASRFPAASRRSAAAYFQGRAAQLRLLALGEQIAAEGQGANR